MNTTASGEGPVDILILEVGMMAVFVFWDNAHRTLRGRVTCCVLWH